MPTVALILILLGATAALQLAALRLHVPHPVLLVIGGLVLALTPGLPHVQLDPEIVFLIFVPPLLYRAAITTSWRDFRAHLRSILLLAIGLVLATMIVVAIVAQRLVPGLLWPTACLLGAIVAPPDPVAATAVIRRLKAPRTLRTILEGEGLVNDATAFVAYRMGVQAVTSGQFDIGAAAARFFLAAAGGIAIGLATGFVIARIRRKLEHVPEVENTISLLTPFAAFIPAERLGLSGVLAVVTVGLYLGREGPRIVSPETRLQAASMWDMVTFLLEGLIFIVVGLDLPLVTQDLARNSLASLATAGLLITLTTMVVRFAWVFPATYLPARIDAWRGRSRGAPRWKHVFFVGWTGMRGADSLVIALALPLTTAAGRPFPGRSIVIFLTFVVILLTLVVQGATLEPLMRWLRLEGGDAVEREETMARLRTGRAGLARLDALAAERPELADIVRELKSRHTREVQRHARTSRDGTGSNRSALADPIDAMHEARATMIDAERLELIRLRDEGLIGDDVLRRVQRDLDLEQMLVGESDEPLESPSHH